jgi:hypothetical protein
MAESSKATTEGGNKTLPPNAPKPPGDARRGTARKQRKGPFVKYVGPASHRTINPAAWKTLQIPLKQDDATHTWSVANDKMIESANFTDEQLDYLLLDDLQVGTGAHSFLEVDFNDDGKLVQVTE